MVTTSISVSTCSLVQHFSTSAKIPTKCCTFKDVAKKQRRIELDWPMTSPPEYSPIWGVKHRPLIHQ